MKKFLFAAIFAAALFTTTQVQAQAQLTTANGTKAMTTAEKDAAKAAKEAAKVKKDADLVDAFTKAGLSADEQKNCRAVLDESNEKTKPVKADASLDDAAKKEKLDAIYKDRNDSLKDIMGAAKYKIFKATQKEQKDAAEAAAN